MLYGTSQYGQIPQVIRHHIDQYHHEQHTPTRNDNIIDTILRDHDIFPVEAGKKILHGVFIGFTVSIFDYMFRQADPKVLTTRATFQPRYYLNRFKTNSVLGGLLGLGWYVLYYKILCPHGEATFSKHLLAYSIGGAALWTLLWHPSSFVFGGVAGLLVGLKQDNYLKVPMPPGFQIQLPGFDPEKRQRAKRDETELQLSMKLIANRASLQHNRYTF